MVKNSKSAIYSIHRKEYDEARKLTELSSKAIKDMESILKKHPHIKISAENALQEYVEAALLLGFVNGKIPSSRELEVDPFTYLCSLSDLTGELARRSVIEATAKNVSDVQKIKDTIEEIHGIMIRFDLRNGDLRKKSDAIKWNLNKVEELLYDLKKKD